MPPRYQIESRIAYLIRKQWRDTGDPILSHEAIRELIEQIKEERGGSSTDAARIVIATTRRVVASRHSDASSD